MPATDEELFGQLLVELGLVDRDLVQRALLEESGTRLGERLVRSGDLPFDGLEEAILAQRTARRALCPVCRSEALLPAGRHDVACRRAGCSGRPVAGIESTQVATQVVPAPTGTPDRVAGFDLLGLIGRGGMGVVFRARDRHLGREVAVKIVPREQDQETVQRFLREARSAARLTHPNIVAVYEVGEDGPWLYIALQLIAGGDLAGRTLEPAEAIAVMVRIADAIEHAHERGIVHRDLKPGNLLVDGSGTPFVTDFGLARLAEGSGSVTRTGTILGSPSYMAPEQARGELDRVGPASDVYSLGATLYALLTGRAPFGGSTPLATLDLVCKGRPTPPSALDSRIPADLEAVCLRAMSLEPGDRHPSAGALAEDLRRIEVGQRPAAPGRPPAARSVAVAGAVVALCLLVGSIAALLGRGEPSEPAAPSDPLAGLAIPSIRLVDGFLIATIEAGGPLPGGGEGEGWLSRAARAIEAGDPDEALAGIDADAPPGPIADRLAALALLHLARPAEGLERLGPADDPELRARLLLGRALVEERRGRDPRPFLVEAGAAGPLYRAEALVVEAASRRDDGQDPRPALAEALDRLDGLADPAASRARGDALLLRAADEKERGLLDPLDPTTLDRAIDAYAAAGDDAEALVRRSIALRLRHEWSSDAGRSDPSDLDRALAAARRAQELAPGAVRAALAVVVAEGQRARRPTDLVTDRTGLERTIDRLADLVDRSRDPACVHFVLAEWITELASIEIRLRLDALPAIDRARSQAERACQLDGANLVARLLAARIESLRDRYRLDQGSTQDASFGPSMGHLDLAAAIDPTSGEVDRQRTSIGFNRARWMLARRQLPEARAEYLEAASLALGSIDRAPDRAAGFFIAARCHLERIDVEVKAGGDKVGAAEEAIRFLERARDSNPRHASTFAVLGQTRLRLARWERQGGRDPAAHLDRAEEDARRAIELRPGSPPFWEDLTEIHLFRAQSIGPAEAEFERALAASLEALVHDPLRYPANACAALALVRLGRGREALAHIARAAKADPGRTRRDLAEVYREAREQAGE